MELVQSRGISGPEQTAKIGRKLLASSCKILRQRAIRRARPVTAGGGEGAVYSSNSSIPRR